jgi:F0F1-type ATP synthase alpha subunit
LLKHKAGDVSAYIPTNVISITRWANFFRKLNYFIGVFVLLLNTGLSVSRVEFCSTNKDNGNKLQGL